MKNLAIAMGLFAAASAVAGENTFEWSATELGTDAGVVATYERVEEFARSYCDEQLHGLKGLPSPASCRQTVMDEVIAKVSHQRLTAYAETGKLRPSLATR